MAFNNLSASFERLLNKFLIAEGLMLNFQNEGIVRNLLADINTDYYMLMIECVWLSDSDLLPGTDTTKLSIKQAKLEFDSRVK